MIREIKDSVARNREVIVLGLRSDGDYEPLITSDGGNLEANIRYLTEDDVVQTRDKVFADVVYNSATIGTSADALSSSSEEIPIGSSLLIKANKDNAGVVYIGDSNVGTGDGFPIDAGEEVRLKVDDVSTVYAIADNADEDLRWIIESD